MQDFQIVKKYDRLKDVTMKNCADGISQGGKHTLSVNFNHLSIGQRVEIEVLTGISTDLYEMKGYEVVGTSTLYSRQTICSNIYSQASSSLYISLSVKVLQKEDDSERKRCNSSNNEYFSYSSQPLKLAPKEWIYHQQKTCKEIIGSVHIDAISINGVPKTILWDDELYSIDEIPNRIASSMGWCKNLEAMPFFKPLVLAHSEEVGFFTQGTREWKDYRIRATIIPKLFESGGIVGYYQGLKRYISVEITENGDLQLIEANNKRTILAR